MVWAWRLVLLRLSVLAVHYLALVQCARVSLATLVQHQSSDAAADTTYEAQLSSSALEDATRSRGAHRDVQRLAARPRGRSQAEEYVLDALRKYSVGERFWRFAGDFVEATHEMVEERSDRDVQRPPIVGLAPQLMELHQPNEDGARGISLLAASSALIVLVLGGLFLFASGRLSEEGSPIRHGSISRLMFVDFEGQGPDRLAPEETLRGGRRAAVGVEQKDSPSEVSEDELPAYADEPSSSGGSGRQ